MQESLLERLTKYNYANKTVVERQIFIYTKIGLNREEDLNLNDIKYDTTYNR